MTRNLRRLKNFQRAQRELETTTVTLTAILDAERSDEIEQSIKRMQAAMHSAAPQWIGWQIIAAIMTRHDKIRNGQLTKTEIEQICSAIVQLHIASALDRMPWLSR